MWHPRQVKSIITLSAQDVPDVMECLVRAKKCFCKVRSLSMKKNALNMSLSACNAESMFVFFFVGSEIWHPDCSMAAALNGEMNGYPVSIVQCAKIQQY